MEAISVAVAFPVASLVVVALSFAVAVAIPVAVAMAIPVASFVVVAVGFAVVVAFSVAKLGTDSFSVTNKAPAKSLIAAVLDNNFVVFDCCRLLNTRNTIPFGWPIKHGMTLFLLFLPGGALSALLLEGVGVEALIKLPFILLSLLSSELAQRLLLL